jgi:hypothetical protein
MQSIVPLIFLLFLIPGVVFGYVAGTVKNHRDIIKGMSKTMSTMGYYIVMAFFAALFIASFGQSNLGALLALKGAGLLKAMALPGAVTMIGIILLTALVNLLIGSASAKWALLAPIFVPMLMTLGFSPELTQAAYRVGDSTTNIITPLMPYFPLVVVYCQRYVKRTGIGHAGVHDVALFDHVPGALDGVPARILDARHPARAAGAIYVSVSGHLRRDCCAPLDDSGADCASSAGYDDSNTFRAGAERG